MNKKAFKELNLYLPAKIIEGVVGIIMIWYYTHQLPSDEYGMFSMTNNYIMALSILLCSWLVHSAFRYILEYKTMEEIRNYNSTVWTCWLLLQFFFLASVGLIYLFIPAFRSWVLMTPIMFLPFSASQLFTAQMSASNKIKSVILLTTGAIILKFSLAFILLRIYNSFRALVLGHGLGDSIMLCILMFRSKSIKNMFMFKLKIDKNLLLDYLHYGVPLMGMALTMVITNLSDRFIIAGTLGVSNTGIYQANYAISSAAFTLIMVGVMRAVNPNILKSWANSKNGIEFEIWQGFRLYLLLATPSVVGIFVLAKQISATILSPIYSQGFNVITWVAAGMFLLGGSEYLIKPLELSKKTGPIFYSSLIAAIINLGLNIILIKKYGYVVASITTFIAYAIYVLLLLIIIKRKFIMYVNFISIFKIVSSSILMGLVVGFIARDNMKGIELFGTIVAGIIIYTIFLFLSGEIKEEIDYFKGKLT